MKTICFCLVCILLGLLPPVNAQSVRLVYPKSSAPASWVAGVLSKDLKAKGYVLNATNGALTITLSIDKKLAAEAFAIRKSQNHLLVSGGDERGLVYGGLS